MEDDALAVSTGVGGIRVVRVLAPNPGLLTGRGTNTWVVGDEDVTVIDPGPDDAGHRQAIERAATPGVISRVVCTHGHPDHREGAARLARELGVGVGVFHAAAWGAGELALHDGDRLEVGRHALRALHTPGHAPDHLCFLVEDDGLCFTGDHVLGGTTTVIDPPSGDMRAYLDSLERLRLERPQVLLPGHGEPLPDAEAAITQLLRHRATREAAVLARLDSGPASPDEMVPSLYADIPTALWPPAARTVLAHCLKLEAEDRIDRRAVEPDGVVRFARRG